jgi:CubicO group peptidase (beta-lactamase class C family)
MKMVSVLALVVLLAEGAVAAPTEGVAAPFLGKDVEARIELAARAVVSSGLSAGVAVGVVRGGQLVFNRAYGLANLELSVPVTASTVFRLASLTKQFTAASVLLLVEQHKLSLDDKLAKYYPDFPRAGQVTIRHLLNHTSGIRDYAEVLSQELGRSRPTGPEFVKRIAGLGYDFDPGTMWNYSNSGYFLLGQIIEKVSGVSFAEFTRANLFDRLAMMDTAVDDEAQVVPFRASGYEAAKHAPSGYVNAPFVSMAVVYAAGATHSTVADLANWNIAPHGGKVLSAESFRNMTAPAMLNNGRLSGTAKYHKPDAPVRPAEPGFAPREYAMGLHLGSLDGHRFIGHEGGIFGFSTMMEVYPDDGLTTIVLANTNGVAGRLQTEIARILLATPAGSSR